jgi:hypothetical protein
MDQSDYDFEWMEVMEVMLQGGLVEFEGWFDKGLFTKGVLAKWEVQEEGQASSWSEQLKEFMNFWIQIRLLGDSFRTSVPNAIDGSWS